MSFAPLRRMSRSERIKEEIGWLKLLFGITVAVDVSLLSWLARNYSTADATLAVGAGATAGLVTAIAVLLYFRVSRRLDELEKQ